ncbi:MAG TPA: hypothetical protein PK653_00040 [Syntrophales bacterium]|nr:hypothetical protein [Syntrophales bacterium]
MKKIFLAIVVLMLAVTPAMAGGGGNNGGSPPGQTETYTQKPNIYGWGAGSASLSGVAGWGCASAFSVNKGSAFAVGSFATSNNSSFGMSHGNAGFLAGGLSAAAVFNYTNKITLTQPK